MFQRSPLTVVVAGEASIAFSTHHGVDADYSYTRNTQSYLSLASALGANANSNEV